MNLEVGKIILKNKDDKIQEKDKFYAGVTFDHSYISEGVHEWIIRRWNTFFISASSIIAMLLSFGLGKLLNISISCFWLLIIAPLIILLSLHSFFSWKHVMGMIEFQTRVYVKKDELIDEE